MMYAGASSSGGAPPPQFSSSQPGLNQISPAFRYIWHNLPFPIILPPPIQQPVSSSFVAVALQVEYDLRIRYAKEGQSFNVGFNPKGWETKVRRHFHRNVSWNHVWDPFYLMELILTEEMPSIVFDGDVRRTGLLVSGSDMNHYCNLIHRMDRPRAETVSEWLLKYRMPLVAIVPVLGSYPSCSQHPYTNIDNLSIDSLLVVQQSHAIVLVGVYDHSKDNNPLGLDISKTYFIYQSSFLEHTIERLGAGTLKSLLPGGMSVVESSLIMNICCTINFPQPAIVHRSVERLRDRIHDTDAQTEAEELKNMMDQYDAQVMRRYDGRQATRRTSS